MSDLAQHDITLFELNRLPSVFENFDEGDFGSVEFAIEERPSQYDDDDEVEEDEDGDVDF